MYHSGTREIPRRVVTRSVRLLAIIWIIALASPSRADLIIGVTTDSFTPGSLSNSFDVTLTNDGADSVTVAGFSFELSATGANSGDVTFSDVTISTVSAAYIFSGNSLFEDNGSISTSISNSGLTIDASDNYATAEQGTMLGSNATLDLGHVIFALSTSTPPSTISISFSPFPSTSLNAPDTTNLSFVVAPNTEIGPAVVPEPASIVTMGIGLVGIFGHILRRRFSVYTKGSDT
jgi:hypothetical protein